MSSATAKIKLEEGKSYPFKISGVIVLPDGQDCFVLTDVNGVKHLLYKSYYRRYNLRVNTEIQCRIDKINCTGKIFIEPEHPIYQPGKSYSFIFDRYHVIENQEGYPEHYAVLRNGHNEEILLSKDEIEISLKKGDKVHAVVERIKKGHVHLSTNSHVNDYSGMEPDKPYHFTVVGEISTDRVYSYYILKNDAGQEFRIRKKFYSDYGINKGDAILCTLQETKQDLFLEPAHPCFEPGVFYSFKILEETYVNEYPGNRKEALRLKNPYGQDPLIKVEDLDPRNITNDTVRCKVKAIKKGQVYLACNVN